MPLAAAAWLCYYRHYFSRCQLLLRLPLLLPLLLLPLLLLLLPLPPPPPPPLLLLLVVPIRTSAVNLLHTTHLCTSQLQERIEIWRRREMHSGNNLLLNGQVRASGQGRVRVRVGAMGVVLGFGSVVGQVGVNLCGSSFGNEF